MASQALNMLRVHQNQLLKKCPRKYSTLHAVRLAGRLHRNLGHFRFLSQVRSCLKSRLNVREGLSARLRASGLPTGVQNARRHVFLMNINSATAAIFLRLHYTAPVRSPSEGRLEKG